MLISKQILFIIEKLSILGNGKINRNNDNDFPLSHYGNDKENYETIYIYKKSEYLPSTSAYIHTIFIHLSIGD